MTMFCPYGIILQFVRIDRMGRSDEDMQSLDVMVVWSKSLVWATPSDEPIG